MIPVRRKSILSGKYSTMYLDVTKEQLERYNVGVELLQDVFPNLDVGEREFIKTGITPEEWDNMHGKSNRL